MAAILIVDDDIDMAQILEALLELDGHEVRLAANGQEGLDQLAIRLPDVVLLDVEMPILDGPNMAYRMFVHNAGMERIPIILSSGATHAALTAQRIGTPYVLGKPYQYSALAEVLNKALAERVAPDYRHRLA